MHPGENSFTELISELYNGLIDFDPEDFRLLREITVNFDEADFYNTYLDPTTTACFEIDLEKVQ